MVLLKLVENLTSPSTLLHSGGAAKALTGKWLKGFGLVAGTGDAAPLKRDLPNRGAVMCLLLHRVGGAAPASVRAAAASLQS